MESWELNNLNGIKFGRWSVIRELHRCSSGSNWLCVCDCGATREVAGKSLRNGSSRSCGCLQKELISSRNMVHGHYHTKIYGVWSLAKDRCNNPKCKHFKDYGGRGIKMCNEWSDNFEKFYIWSLGNGYSENLTIDRKDNNGNYEPGNCRWITMTDQQSNKRNNVFLTSNNKTQTVAAWSRETGVKITTLHYRIKHGWGDEGALWEKVARCSPGS